MGLSQKCLTLVGLWNFFNCLGHVGLGQPQKQHMGLENFPQKSQIF